MIVKEIERIRGNVNAVNAYRTGLKALFDSGIIDALRMLGRPAIRSDSDHTHMAAQGAMSAGWNNCLDTLLYFEEKYLSEIQETPNVQMDFGALESALKNGDISEEEAYAIRNRKSISYRTNDYTGNIENPKRS